MIRSYGSRARFAVQDLGASPLAERFGVGKYPAIFVDDALIARPEDFYAWGGPATGKYIPWNDAANRQKFQRDLRRMIDIRLAGGAIASLPSTKNNAPRTLPDIALTDLQGRTFRLRDLRGKPTLVELWAPWCPPCLQSMTRMKELDTASINIVLIAIESDRKDVDEVVAKMRPPGRIVMASDAVREAFDGPPAVPTFLLTDGRGQVARIIYGTPPNVHDEIAREMERVR